MSEEGMDTSGHTRGELLNALAIDQPTHANAYATILIWRLLRSIAFLLFAMDIVLVGILIELLH